MGDTKGKMSNSHRGSLNTILSLKKKRKEKEKVCGEASYGEVSMKSGVCYADFSSPTSPLMRVSSDLKLSFSERDRERDKKRRKIYFFFLT